MPLLYTTGELADALRMKPGTLRNKLSRGEDLPPSIRVGRRRLFPKAQFEAWLRARETPNSVAIDGASIRWRQPRPSGRPRQPVRV